MSSNEGYRTPMDAQLRYTVQWFHEWSEMQRGDFLPILAQKLAPGSYINGVMSGIESMSCSEGRPPSLFQCRVKLFHEWFETWGQAERDQFLGHIKSMDPAFYSKMQEELQSLSSGSKPPTVSMNSESPESPSVSDDSEIEVQGNNPVIDSEGVSLEEDSSNVAVNGD